MIPINDALRVIECASAEQLVDELRSLVADPGHGVARSERWLWRGQRDATWDLVPSAFRPGELLGYQHRSLAREVTGRDLGSADQHRAEFYAVAEFVYLADELGLHIPGDTGIFRHQRVSTKVVGAAMGRGDWPPPALLEAMALAQHHGVPTRLLDFSYRSSVAAFFAAAGALNGSAEKFAVWGVDYDFIVAATHSLGWGEQIIRVTVPRMFNRFLHAQHGLFLLDTGVGAETDDGPAPGELNRSIAAFAEVTWKQTTVVRDWKPMVQLVVPRAEARQVLKLLALEGVDRAHLMPTLDNVVNELKSRRENTIVADPFEKIRGS